MPSDADGDDFWLDAGFFVEKTPARRKLLLGMVKELELPPPKRGQRHVLREAFGLPETGPYLVSHIDESKYENDPTNYYVQLHVHGERTRHAHEKVAAGGRFSFDWAIDRLVALAKGEDELLMFFDAEMTCPTTAVKKMPGGVVAVPLAIGGCVLPLTGVEYSSDVDSKIHNFRWSRRSGSMVANVSYTSMYTPEEIRHIWARERATVDGYVKEAIPQ